MVVQVVGNGGSYEYISQFDTQRVYRSLLTVKIH